MLRYSVRIKLTDFIGTQQEEQIIATIFAIGEETNKKVFLKLWYVDGELTQEDVVVFVKHYEKILEDIGTNIHIGENETWSQKSWFNIRKFGTTTSIDYRHEYMYNNAVGILEALSVFRKMLPSMDDIRAIQSQPPQQQKKEGNGHQNGYRVTIRKVPNVQ